MDIVECLRATTESNALHNEAVAEIERLRAENEIFRTALQCADVAMAGAPIWHAQHRVLRIRHGERAGLEENAGKRPQGP